MRDTRCFSSSSLKTDLWAEICWAQRPWEPGLLSGHSTLNTISGTGPSPPGGLADPLVWEQGSLWRCLGCAQLLPTPHALSRPARHGVLLLTRSRVRSAPKWARRPGVSTAASLGGRGPRTAHTQCVSKWLLGSHLL